jgi:hypothetical protein
MLDTAEGAEVPSSSWSESPELTLTKRTACLFRSYEQNSREDNNTERAGSRGVQHEAYSENRFDNFDYSHGRVPEGC